MVVDYKVQSIIQYSQLHELLNVLFEEKLLYY